MKYQETALIKEQREIAPGVFSLWLQTEHIAEEARPGQFVSVYCHDESRLLPRPISICEIDKENNRIVLDAEGVFLTFDLSRSIMKVITPAPTTETAETTKKTIIEEDSAIESSDEN